MASKLVTGLFLAGAAFFGASAALAQSSQQPSISSAWENMQLSQDECFNRARSTMERLNYRRIERIGNSTFGDQGDFQIAIRCVSEKQMYYVFGGGPGDKDAQLDRYINELKAAIGAGR